MPMVHHTHHPTFSLACRDELDAAAIRTVFDGIGQEVDEHLVQQIGVANDYGTSRVSYQGHVPRLGQVFDLRGSLLDDRLQIEFDKRLTRRRLRFRQRQQRLR